MDTPNPYELADRENEILRKKAIRRFQRAQQKLKLLDFDELNVISVCKDLYAKLDEDNKKGFLDLAQHVYKDADPHGDELLEMAWLLGLLDDYNEVTRYVYNHEVERKRAYLEEGIISAPTVTAKNKEIEKGLRYWVRFSSYYTDIISDEARLKAFKDAGVKKVMWVTEHDEKVCSICEPLDGKIFLIDKAPQKAHLNCRCYYVAVKD